MYPGCRVGHIWPDVLAEMSRDETMADLFEAGYTREDVLGALRILPFVGSCGLVSSLCCGAEMLMYWN